MHHPYQHEMLPLNTSGLEPPPIPEIRPPGQVLRIVRENGENIARCPGCGERLRFGRAAGQTIRTPRDLADLLVDEMSALEREELRVALLNTKNGILAVETVYVGNVSAALVRVSELFTVAVRVGAVGLIVVHNHPSGDPTPSPDDLHLTAEAVAAGRILDVAVLDHLVIAGGTFVSLRDRGLAFNSPGDHRAGESSGGPPWRHPWLGVCKSSLQKAIRRADVPLAVWSAEQLLAMPGGRSALGRRLGAIAAEDVGGCWFPAVGRAAVAAQDAGPGRAAAVLTATAAGLATVQSKNKEAYWLCDLVWGGRHLPARTGRVALTEVISTGDHREALAICLEAIQRRQWRSGERAIEALLAALADGPELTREIGRWGLWRQGLGGSGSEESLAAAVIAAIDRPDGVVLELPEVRPDPPTEPLKLPVWVFDGHTAPGSRAIARLAQRTGLSYQLLSDLVFDYQSIQIAPHELPSRWRDQALELDGRLAGWGSWEDGARLWASLRDQWKAAVEDELRRSPQPVAAPHGWSQRGA